MSTGAPKVAVPNVIGDTDEDATRKLEGDDYELQGQDGDQGVRPGARHRPGDRTRRQREVEKGSTITLTVAEEKKQSTVPDVSRQDL